MPGVRILQAEPRGKDRRVAVVASRWNPAVVDRLLAGALKTLRKAGVRDRDILLVRVPGAFEIPAAACRLADSGRFHAVVAVGCVLEGETPHFALVTETCAGSLAALSAEGRVGVGMGVLSCHTLKQALARSMPRGINRGAEAAEAALEMAVLLPLLGRRRP